MPPSKIMILRHAEKPPRGGGPPFGIRMSGEPSLHALTVRGWTRAGALISFFANARPPIDRPDAIFAATPDSTSATAHGERPSQTIAPLAAVLGVAPNTSYAVGDETALVAAILASGGVVLVCWEHHALTGIVSQFPGQTSFTELWPDDRFDLVWMLDFDGHEYKLSKANQQLLDGDALRVG